MKPCGTTRRRSRGRVSTIRILRLTSKWPTPKSRPSTSFARCRSACDVSHRRGGDAGGGELSTNSHDISLVFLEHRGSEISDPNSPAEMATPPDDIMQRRLLVSITRSVSSLDRAILNDLVTTADLTAAILHMRATSATGMDGLTAGFYQFAADVFGECLSMLFCD